MDYYHFFITGFLSVVLCFIFFYNKNPKILYSVIIGLLILNFFTFNIYLIKTNNFNYKIHLPLHLCYLTEFGILVSVFFKSRFFNSWLLLNSLGGGITGFLNSNLSDGSLFIEYTHLYLSHFNLILFAIFLYKSKFFISKSDLIYSVFLNTIIFISVVFLNIVLGSNYWFTEYKPGGLNLTLFLPGWPYYLFILIVIGLISYYFTYKIFLKNKQIL